MKYKSLKVIALVLLSAGGVVAACASPQDDCDCAGSLECEQLCGGFGDVTTGSGSTSTGVGGSGGAGATASGVGGAGGVATTSSGQPDAGGVCVPMCNADSDCQNSCPATQTGINCCDAPSGLCYVNSSAMCPAPPPDGGTMMPPY